MAIENTATEVRYTVKYGDEWQPDMINTYSDDDSNRAYAGIIGKPITYLTMEGVDKYRVYTTRRGWSKYFTKYDKDNPAGDGSPIIAIEIWDKTARIAVHIKDGEWLPSEPCTFEGDSRKIRYAGVKMAIDAFWINKE